MAPVPIRATRPSSRSTAFSWSMMWTIRAGNGSIYRASPPTNAAYDEALVPFLADLARSDLYVARGLARRVEAEEPGLLALRIMGMRFEGQERSRAVRLARGLLDQAGSALPEDVRERLSRIASQPAAKD